MKWLFACIALIQPASAFQCVNLNQIEAQANISDSEMTDAWNDTSAMVALQLINSVLSPVVLAGDRVVIVRANDNAWATAYVMNRRGGGMCVTAYVPIPPGLAQRIASVIEQARASNE